MRQIRIQRQVVRRRAERPPVLPLDPRDPDVLRAKAVARRGDGAYRGLGGKRAA